MDWGGPLFEGSIDPKCHLILSIARMLLELLSALILYHACMHTHTHKPGNLWNYFSKFGVVKSCEVPIVSMITMGTCACVCCSLFFVVLFYITMYTGYTNWYVEAIWVCGNAAAK